MIRVSFGCNDERGLQTGRFEAIDFSDLRGFGARLEGPSIRFIEEHARVKVSRRFFAIVPGSAKYGVGNWCWDGVRMSKREAQRLLAYVIERGFVPVDWTNDGPFAALIDGARPAEVA